MNVIGPVQCEVSGKRENTVFIVVTQQPKSKLYGNEYILNYQFTEQGREHACQCCRRRIL